MNRKWKKILIFLLSCIMSFIMSVSLAYADEDISEDNALYEEYNTIIKCVHKHTEECYLESDEIIDLDATPSEAESNHREPAECTHECSEESGCIKKENKEEQTESNIDSGTDSGAESEAESETESDKELDAEKNTESDKELDAEENIESDEKPEAEQEQSGKPDCICQELCIGEDINIGCPVCSIEGVDLSLCLGEENESEKKIILTWKWM